MAQKFRKYVFTYWPDTEEDISKFQTWATDNVKYMLFGDEICPTTGRRHLQGHLEFKNARSFKATARLWKWRIDVQHGSQEQCEVYEKKDGKIWEFGERPVGQGRRTDLMTLKKLVLSGGSWDEVLEMVENPQQLKFAESLRKYVKPKKREPPTVYWLYGKTGTGKSKWIEDNFPTEDVFWKNKTKWYDGYMDQPVVVIDDYRPDFCKFSELLNLLDRYPIRVEIKGSGDWFRASTIVITSNKSPQDHWRSRTDEDLQQLMRRITHVIPFGTGTEVTGGNIKTPVTDIEFLEAHKG